MSTSGGNILSTKMMNSKYPLTVLLFLIVVLVNLLFFSAEPAGVLFAESLAVEEPTTK